MDTAKCGIIGEIRSNGYDRNISLIESILVGVVRRIVTYKLTCHPPIWTANGIGSFFETIDPLRLSLPANFDSFNLVGRETRDVHIQCRASRNRMQQSLLKDVTDCRCACIKVGLGAMAKDRKTDGGKTIKTSLEHCAYGSAVNNIDGSIATIIYTRKDNIGTAGTEMLIAHLDTISGSTVAGKMVLVSVSYGMHTQGSAGSNGGTQTRSIAVRCHDNNIAKLPCHTHKVLEPA